MIVIGSGLLAQSFKKSKIEKKDIIVFASGVSMSSCKSSDEFKREEDLLKNYLKHSNLKLVYFSTSSIDKCTSTPYLLHKKNMEQLIIDTSSNFLIIRLPNVVGTPHNNNQLIPRLYNQILTGKQIQVNPFLKRSLVSVNDIPKIVFELVPNVNRKEVITCSLKNELFIYEIIEYISTYLKKKAFIKQTFETELELYVDKKFLKLIEPIKKQLQINPFDIIKRFIKENEN